MADPNFPPLDDESTVMINKMRASMGQAPLGPVGAPPPDGPPEPTLGVADVVKSISSSGAAPGGSLPPTGPGAGLEMGLAPGKYQTSRNPRMEAEALRNMAKSGFTTRDLDEKYKAAQDAQVKGLNQIKAAQEKLGQNQADVWELTQLKEEAERARHEVALKKANEEADLQQKKNDALATELAGMKPTARNPYSENGGGKGIALVLLSAIAGAASGLQGRENRSIEIINGNIEADYQRQKDAYERGERGLGEGRNLYREIAQKIKDEDERHATFANVNYLEAQKYLAQAADRAQSESSQGEIIKSIGLLEQSMLDRKAAQRAQAAQMYFQKWKGVAEIAGQQDMSVIEGSGVDRFPKSSVGGLTYNGGADIDPGTKKAVEEKWTAAQNIRDILKEAVALRKLKGSEVWDRDAVAKGKDLMEELKIQLNDFYGWGSRITKDKLELLGVPEDLLETSANIVGGSDRTLKKIIDLQGNIQTQTDNLLKTANYQRTVNDDWRETDAGERPKDLPGRRRRSAPAGE